MNQNMRDNSTKARDSTQRDAMLKSVYGIGETTDASDLSDAIDDLLNATTEDARKKAKSEITRISALLSAGNDVGGMTKIEGGRYQEGADVSDRRSARIGTAAQMQGQRFGRNLDQYSIVNTGERVKPFIQTLHKSVAISADKLGGANVSLKIVGSHPLIELIVCIQLNENMRSNSWTNLSTVMSQCWYGPAVTAGDHRGGAGGSDTAGPYGYEFVSSGVAKSRAPINPKASEGPIANLQMSANANVRHSKAPGSHYSRLVPHIMHSNSPDEQNGAYFYSVPIALPRIVRRVDWLA